MSRVVYIGGFGNGRSNANRVAAALACRYEEVDAFTFSEATLAPNMIRRAVKGVEVITHSAGMLALRGSSPDSIGAIGAPLPRPIPVLLGMTAYKEARLYLPGLGVRKPSDVANVLKYDGSCTGELVVHPVANLGALPQISEYNAVTEAVNARAKGIPVLLGYNDRDEYFQLPSWAETRARHGGVDVVRMPGIHDELVIRPEQTLQAFLDAPLPPYQPKAFGGLPRPC